MTVNNCQSRGVTEPQREVDFAEQKTEGECESLLFLSVAASNVKLHAGSFHRKRSPSLPEGGQMKEKARAFSSSRLRFLMFCHPFRNFTM